MKRIQDIDIKNKKILLRLDLNVPIIDGKIVSDKRIEEAISTVNYLIDNGAQKITIITHLGKPKGKVCEEHSLWPIANCLAKLLKIEIKFNNAENEYKINDKISMLENLRFNHGEEENDSDFAKQLAENQDIFVNDAFGTLHRAHASTVGVTKDLPSYAGLLVQKEVEKLEEIAVTSEKLFTVILGGAKISDKLPVLKNLTSKAKDFIIGGANASTFLAARRHYLGKSLVEEKDFREANIIWQNIMDEVGRSIYLPTDMKVSKSLEAPSEMKIIKTSDTLKPNYMDGYYVVDIGPDTIEHYKNKIKKSKIIFWNGNMGVSEVPEFSEGTMEIAKAIMKCNARVVVGGGDTVAACEEIGMKTNDRIFLSTGGGATLEFLAGKVLPGLKALE
jgi:phosphoglycerate kinase